METTQNPGETEAAPLTALPEDSLEHVLDAWGSERSSRPRYDRLRLERRDGEALEVLIDSDAARDLGDKLTIIAARTRHRTRGAAGVSVDQKTDPGDAEDLARARKVAALLGLDATIATYVSGEFLLPLVEEFRASREDVTKAHAMVDAAQARYREIEIERADRARIIDGLRAELESVKADRNKLIAEAAQRDVAKNMPGPIVMEFLAWLRAQESPDTDLWSDEDETLCAEFFAQRIEALSTIDLSDPSERANPLVTGATDSTVSFGPDGEIAWEEFKETERSLKAAGLNPTNGEVFAEAERRRTRGPLR